MARLDQQRPRASLARPVLQDDGRGPSAALAMIAWDSVLRTILEIYAQQDGLDTRLIIPDYQS